MSIKEIANYAYLLKMLATYAKETPGKKTPTWLKLHCNRTEYHSKSQIGVITSKLPAEMGSALVEDLITDDIIALLNILTTVTELEDISANEDRIIEFIRSLKT